MAPLNGHVSDRESAASGAIEQVADYAADVSSADQILSAPIELPVSDPWQLRVSARSGTHVARRPWRCFAACAPP
jgi:hypothetical protein